MFWKKRPCDRSRRDQIASESEAKRVAAERGVADLVVEVTDLVAKSSGALPEDLREKMRQKMIHLSYDLGHSSGLQRALDIMDA